MDTNECAAVVGIERGTVVGKKADGSGYAYKVRSATRDGIVSRWMESVNAYVNEYSGDPPEEIKRQYDVGDLVYFFMFGDGRGMVLGKVRREI